jgi:hypothetical protein
MDAFLYGLETGGKYLRVLVEFNFIHILLSFVLYGRLVLRFNVLIDSALWLD